MDRYKFRCKYCQGTRLKKSNAGGYACGDCGRQPDTMIPSSMVVNESYVKSAANVRSRGFVVEKVTAEKQVSINDLEHHLEEKWLDYLQYFQEALKYNITHLQQRLALDPKVKEITKKIWLKYLDKWSQSKRRIVSFFSVPRKGLYKESDPTFPKRKYNFDLEELDELSDLEDEEDLYGEHKQEKEASQTFNFDFIFSQMTQTSTQITTNKEEQKAKDEKKKDDKDKFKESRSEFYSSRYWAKRKDDEKEKLKKKRRKNSEHHEIKEVRPKEHSSLPKKKSGFAKDLFSETPAEFLKNLHSHYVSFTSNTISQIIEDYNQILNFHKGDRKEKIRSIKRRSSYIKVDYLQELLKERKIEPEVVKLCHSRQAFQKMAKDLVFIHDFFCFTVYRHAELEPIPFSNIEYHIKELAEKESDEDDDENMDEQKKKEEALIRLAKEYISKHLANKEEALRPKKKPAQKLFALEFNLIPLICFVALRLANYPVFPRDIVQWIKYQILPFFTAHLNIPYEGLKEYLIKPLNIPSSSWIRASYKRFIKIYEIESAITPVFAEKLMERVFLDCEIPYPLLKPCVHLYEFLNLIRKDNLAKPIDEDLVILSVILGTLRLFYGFDDNFYGVFLKMGKVEEASQTLQDEGLKHDLLNMINTFSKHQNRNPTMKCYTSIPKFDNMVQKFQEKISQRKFDHYFQVDGIPFAWDYKDLKDVNKDNIMTYLDITRRSMYPEENQSEFIKLQNYFERINLKDGEDMETSEQNTMINTRIEVNKDLFANGKNCSKQRTVSKFFSEEIKFFLKHSSEKTTMEVVEEETVDLPLPCDNYFVYKKLKSIPHEKIKHEFLFLLDVFSTYLHEPVEDIQKGLKFVDKNLVKLVSLLED